MTQLPKAILFDWDGTLADTSQMVVDAHNHVRTMYNKPLIGMEDIFGGVTKSAREAFPDIYGAEHALKAEEELYKYIHDNRTTALKPLPGAQELLNIIIAAGIPTGIVSNKRHEGLGQEIEALEWLDTFGIYVGAGEAREDKPSAAPLLLALERMGGHIAPEEIWYVGDTEADLLCAQNAGSPCVYIPHAHGNPALSALYKPQHEFETLDAFALMLAELLKKRA